MQWDGANGFQCVDGYEWKLGAGLASADSGIEINDSNLVSFLAGNGLSVSRSGSSITYNANLASIFGSTACSATQKLTWNGASVMCVEDIDTKYDAQITSLQNQIASLVDQTSGTTFIKSQRFNDWTCRRDSRGAPFYASDTMVFTIPGNASLEGAWGSNEATWKDGSGDNGTQTNNQYAADAPKDYYSYTIISGKALAPNSATRQVEVRINMTRLISENGGAYSFDASSCTIGSTLGGENAMAFVAYKLP